MFMFLDLKITCLLVSEAYPEHCQTSKTELFAKIVNGFQRLKPCLTFMMEIYYITEA